MIEQDFIPYKQALELKELGLNLICFEMSRHEKKCEEQEKPNGCQLHNLHCGFPDCTIDKTIVPIPLPLYQQAFRWFREKYNLCGEIYSTNTGSIDFSFMIRDLATELYIYDNFQANTGGYSGTFETYEEVELACLIKLIEIVKNKNNEEI